MTLIDKTEAVTLLHEIADDFADPHVRGAAIAVAHIFTERADTLPHAKQEHVADSNARGVVVKPLVFRDETGDGVLTSRETGELFRIFPQHDGVFFAPKLPEGENTAPDAQTLIDRYNARWSARILAALEGRE